MIPMHHVKRRSVLRGVMGGAAVSVGLPYLDCFLNTNGTALAATGTQLPTRFGTWFWGLGLNPGRWEPKDEGKMTEMGIELQPLNAYKDRMNVFSGLKAFLDGKPLQVHTSGANAILTGSVPRGQASLPSIDTIVADAIGTQTRFRSLEAASAGNATHSQSRRSGAVVNPAEVSPAALYTRIFGAEFQDPNASTFTPDPAVMARRSALSAVIEDRKSFEKTLGAADKARLDEYFTSLRSLEQQLDLQLKKPAPLEACTKPADAAETPVGTEIEMVKANHKIFAGLLAHALACGQTRVINMAFTDSTSSLRKAGGHQTHHEYSHEEPVDAVLGYQPTMAWFFGEVMTSFAYFLDQLDGIKEGDRTLLDRTLIMTGTDHGYAKLHGIENIPVFTVGGANGRVKTGLHFRAVGDTVSRIGLTVQQAMGVPVSTWGTESNQTSKPFADMLA
ncbi:MAG: DUF1552 domain-containing protein [Rhodospirillaceae bacterium]|nr:DUF1552 domain-containing protein [Rhodospirillaceae bacterium]